jgi:hypothetical protein
MKPFFVRPSMILKHDDCPAAYDFQYEKGITTEATSVNLPFGTAVHSGSTGWIEADALGKHFDPVDAFKAEWKKALDNETLSFPSDKDPDDYEKMGVRLTETFPDAWKHTGLQVLIDPQGQPVVERRLQSRIAPGIVLSGTPDVLATNEDFDVVVPDIKTPAQASLPFFASASEQLTAYQMLSEDEGNRALIGIDRIDRLGFFEGIKRKVPKSKKAMGPTWEKLLTVPRHSKDQVNNLIRKEMELKRDRERGYFPKRPRMAFNTPCGMCDYRNWCHFEDPTGLVWKQKKAEPAKASNVIPAAAVG